MLLLLLLLLFTFASRLQLVLILLPFEASTFPSLMSSVDGAVVAPLFSLLFSLPLLSPFGVVLVVVVAVVCCCCC